MSAISVNKNKYTFTWIIEEFSLYSLNYFDDDEIRSPLFTTDHIGPASWFLTIRGFKIRDRSRGECSLVRYSEDEGSDTIRIQWKLNVTSENEHYRIVDSNDTAIINGYKKGYSCTKCFLCISTRNEYTPFITSEENADLVTLVCQITEYSPVQKPVCKSSVVRSKVQEFIWFPQYLSESKLFCGFQNTQYELFFHVSGPVSWVRIRRSDSNHLIICYVSCGLKINGRKKNALNASINRLLKPFIVNDICDVSNSVNYLSNKKFSKSELCIEGTVITSVLVEDNYSTFAWKQSIFNGINATLNLDTTDLFKKNVRIYEDKRHTDVILKIGFESFPAHKCFLTACSPVFSAMFDQDMIESQTGVVNITDMDVSTLKLLLKYVYTDVIEGLNYKGALKLLRAAEKYQMLTLKEKCVAYLLDNLSEENVCEILVVADMISCSELKKLVSDYVKSNANKVLGSKKWKQFVKKNANLASECLMMISEEFGTAK